MFAMRINKILIGLLLVSIFTKTIVSRSYQDRIEIKAVTYFLNVVMKPNNEIKFDMPEYTIGIPTKIYDVAFTLNKINLLKDSVPQREYLDKIEKNNRANSLLNTKILLQKRQIQFNKNAVKWGMTVYNAIEFEGMQYVEITLFHKKSNSEQIFCIEFKGGEVQKWYTKELVYD